MTSSHRTFALLASLVLSSARGSAETCTDTSNTGGRQPEAVVSELLDWLRENGAYINEKLAVGHVVPEDPTSPRGVFATDDMDAGETVCVIPWDLMIMPGEVIDPSRDDDCGTIDAIYDAMSEGGKTPYARYLLDQPKDYLPSFWSQVSKSMSASHRVALALTFDDQRPYLLKMKSHILMIEITIHRLLETYCRTCCKLRGRITLRNTTSFHVSISYSHHPFLT